MEERCFLLSALRQFLGNSSVNTFQRQRARKQQKNGAFYVVRAEKL
jgi:hypothetical protein